MSAIEQTTPWGLRLAGRAEGLDVERHQRPRTVRPDQSQHDIALRFAGLQRVGDDIGLGVHGYVVGIQHLEAGSDDLGRGAAEDPLMRDAEDPSRRGVGGDDPHVVREHEHPLFECRDDRAIELLAVGQRADRLPALQGLREMPANGGEHGQQVGVGLADLFAEELEHAVKARADS